MASQLLHRVIIVAIFSLILIVAQSTEVDLRTTSLNPHPWEYLEISSAQRGDAFGSVFPPAPNPYPRARGGPVVTGIKGRRLLFLFSGYIPGPLLQYSDTWLYSPPPANSWEFIDSDSGATKGENYYGSVSGITSYPGFDFIIFCVLR